MQELSLPPTLEILLVEEFIREFLDLLVPHEGCPV